MIAGIESAQAAGLTPLKVDAVFLRASVDLRVNANLSRHLVGDLRQPKGFTSTVDQQRWELLRERDVRFDPHVIDCD